jgi:TP901 family phage tail tape measure protein
MPGSKIGKNDFFDDSFFQAVKQAKKDLNELLVTFEKMAKEAREVSKGVQAAKTFDDLSKKAAKAGKSIKDLTAEEKKLERAQQQLNFAQTEAGKKLAVLNEQKRRAAAENRKYAKSQLEAEKSTNRWGVAIKSFQFKFNALGNLIATAAATVFRAFVRVVRQSVETIKSFDSETARLASVLGKTREEIKDLTKEAKQLGAITQFTAGQVTGLQIELAKLGFAADEIKNATPGILSFATATGADLADAAKVAGVAVRAFGLDTLETEDAVSTLAVATTKSALSFGDYETILSTLGPVAKAYGFTLEDTVALTGKLRDAGFESNKAATATRNILLNLADTNGALAKSLGGSVDNFDDLIDGLITLNEKGVSLGETLELTDVRSVAAFNQFLSTAEGARTLRDSITGVNDQLQDMVDVQLDTLAGDIDLLKSAWEGFIHSAAEGGALREIVQLLTNAVLQVSNLDLAFTKFHKQNQNQIRRSFELLTSLTNRQGEEFKAVVEDLDTIEFDKLIPDPDLYAEQFAKIRHVNKKEAVALAREYIQVRFEQHEAEVRMEVAKIERIAELNKEQARKKKVSYEDVTEELKQLAKDEMEAITEETQEAVTAQADAWDYVAQATEGAFATLEERVQGNLETEVEQLEQKRQAYEKFYDDVKAMEADRQDMQIATANEAFYFLSSIIDRKAAKIDQQLADELISEEQAEKEKAKLRKKAAIIDKSQALFNIALNTALGVTSAAAKTVTIPLIPWIIGLGAAQAAAVLAEPIPAFEKGTEAAPGGAAIVGEKGRELMFGPDGKIALSPDSATLMSIDKGTRIIPADVTTEIMKYAAVATGMGKRANDTELIVKMMARIDDSSERLRRELKNKPVSSSILTPAGILTSTYKGNTVIKKMNKYFG